MLQWQPCAAPIHRRSQRGAPSCAALRLRIVAIPGIRAPYAMQHAAAQRLNSAGFGAPQPLRRPCPFGADIASQDPRPCRPAQESRSHAAPTNPVLPEFP